MPVKTSPGPSAFSLEDLQRLSQSTPRETETRIALTPRTPKPGSGWNSKDAALVPRPKNRLVLDQYEDILGGREGVIDALRLNTLDKKGEHFLSLLCDPKTFNKSLYEVSRTAHVTVQTALDLLRSAAAARSYAVAMGKISEALPDVMTDMLDKSVDAEVCCPECFGDPVPGYHCEKCHGRGTILRESDLDRQKLVLEAAGVVVKKTGGVNVQVNQQVGIAPPSNFFSKVVKASDDVAYDIGPVTDAEVVEPND